MGTKFDKAAAHYANPVLKGSYFEILDTKGALARKTMQSPLFSKEAVRRSEHLITDLLAKFLQLMSGYASAAKPVDLTLAFRCLAADISMNYGFQRPFHTLDAEGFDSEILDAQHTFILLFMWPVNFPRFFGAVFEVLAWLPRWFVNRFTKSLALMKLCLEVSHDQITYLQKRSTSSEETPRTVFDITLHPNREKGQFTPTVEEMVGDAFALLSAGTDTTSYTELVITWALLNNPQMMQRLKAELRVAMPGRDDTVDWAGSEQLPYLSTLTKRSAPLSKKVSASPLAFQDAFPASYLLQAPSSADRRYQPEHVSPTRYSYRRPLIKVAPQTIVSSSCYVYHLDSHIFKDPEAFRPERWLTESTSDAKEMESFFMPFSKGSRMCIGINLAYAVLHLTLAHFLRRFEISNKDTSDADMQWEDFFVPKTKGHLKVMLRETVD